MANEPVRLAWHQLSHSQMFQDAADVAMLELLSAAPMFAESIQEAGVDMAKYRTMCAQLRLEGARLFLSVFQHLGELPRETKAENIHTLNHNV